MADVMSALPSRALQGRPPLLIWFHLRRLFGLCIVASLVLFAVAWLTPGLVTDWLVRDSAVPVLGADLRDGACHNRLFIEDCDATLTAAVRTPAGATGTLTRDVHYVFTSTGGDFTSRVLADPRRPEWLTTDLGLDRFWDRVAVDVFGSALLMALFVFGVRSVLRSVRVRLSWRTASLRPVALQLVSVRRAGLSATWTVRSGTGHTVAWGVPRWAKPCVLGPADRVLGLAPAGAGAALPIDSKLRWIKLSRQERRAALGG